MAFPRWIAASTGAIQLRGAPSSIRLPHLYSINQVRLAVEAKRPDDLWESERQIRKELPPVVKGESQPHTPDVLLTNTANGKITAIEVEYHARTDGELENDLRAIILLPVSQLLLLAVASITLFATWYGQMGERRSILRVNSLATLPPLVILLCRRVPSIPAG